MLTRTNTINSQDDELNQRYSLIHEPRNITESKLKRYETFKLIILKTKLFLVENGYINQTIIKLRQESERIGGREGAIRYGLTVGASELGDGIDEAIVELSRPPETGFGIRGENQAGVRRETRSFQSSSIQVHSPKP